MKIKKYLVSIFIVIVCIINISLIKWASTSKKDFKVDAPAKMEEDFTKALKEAGLNSEYEIVISDKNPDITVSYGKENDSEYHKIAYSPFIVAINKDSSLSKELQKANTIEQSQYESDDDIYTINLSKFVSNIINNTKMKDLGFPSKISIFVPSKNSIYWTDFYNLLLITVNNGIYPKDKKEHQEAEKVIQSFFESKRVVQVDNFEEKLVRTNYFSENALYIIPEILAITVSYNGSSRLIYPLNTVNFNYYVKGNSENGKKVVSNLLTSNEFFKKLNKKYFRCDKYLKLPDSYSSVYGQTDAYDLVNPYK